MMCNSILFHIFFLASFHFHIDIIIIFLMALLYTLSRKGIGLQHAACTDSLIWQTYRKETKQNVNTFKPILAIVSLKQQTFQSTKQITNAR